VSGLYLLDTDVISEAARNPGGQVASRIRRIAREQLFTSVIVLAEIRYGFHKNPVARARSQIERLIDALDVQELPCSAADHYARIRHGLTVEGRQIGGNDYWIAAHALAEDAVLVSNNMREFARVQNLRVEDWQQQT
jgi:tRNA(fMet)-specific endonuclease VapC